MTGLQLALASTTRQGREDSGVTACWAFTDAFDTFKPAGLSQEWKTAVNLALAFVAGG